MNSLAYTVSPILTKSLGSIDTLRTTILLTPITPLVEARLRWRTTRLPNLDENQRMAFGSLRSDWTAASKSFTVKSLETIADLVFPLTKRSLLRKIEKEEREWKRLFSYLSAQKDHPVIQAGLLLASLSESALNEEPSFPRMVASLSLASNWYDCRGMVATPSPAERAGTILERYGQLTLWLETFTKDCITSYEVLAQTIATTVSSPPPPTWNLTNRHKRILSLYENPKTTLTNRDVQRLFHVSQVTASRDLSHLSGLGLLYAHGKGRSVYYTKV